MEFPSFINVSDSRIEGQYMQQALQGVNKRETAGFSVVSVPLRNSEVGNLKSVFC